MAIQSAYSGRKELENGRQEVLQLWEAAFYFSEILRLWVVVAITSFSNCLSFWKGWCISFLWLQQHIITKLVA